MKTIASVVAWRAGGWKSEWGRFAALLVAGLLAAGGLSGCEAAKNMLAGADKPTARLTGLSLQGLTADSATLLIDVEVANPYPAPMPLTDFDYALSSRGAQFLTGKASPTGTIPAKGKSTVQVPATLQFSQLMSALQGVRPGALIPFRAEAGLTVAPPQVAGVSATEPVRLPVAKEGNLPFPAAPEISVKSLAWDELSLNRAAGTLELNVKNTNEFAAGLTALAGGLSLGGTRVAEVTAPRALRLKSGETGTLSVPFSVSGSQIGAGLLSMLTGSKASYALEGSATLDTPMGPATLPISALGEAATRRK